MNDDIKTLFVKLTDKDDDVRYPAFRKAYELTSQKVDWVYQVWGQLLTMLESSNSFQRNIAVKLLCNLSRSDDEKRMTAVLPKILAHTKDEKFITSRQTLQEVWKIAWSQPDLCPQVVDQMVNRFAECATENHVNLLRLDIVQSLTTLAELRHDEVLQAEVERLIASEPDEKNRKAYRAVNKE